MSKHTELPWGFNRKYSDSGYRYHAIFNNKYDDVLGQSGYIKTDDCRFIVKACNNHYQLIAALELIASGENENGLIIGSAEMQAIASQAIKDASDE